MRKTKSFISILLVMMFFVSCGLGIFSNKSYADEETDPQKYVENNVPYLPRNKFEISTAELRLVYTWNMSSSDDLYGPAHAKFEQSPDEGKLYMLHGGFGTYDDNCFDATDTSQGNALLKLPRVSAHSNPTIDSTYADWLDVIDAVKQSLVDGKREDGINITKDDIRIEQTVAMLPVEGFNGEIEYSISTENGLSQENYTKMEEMAQVEKKYEEDEDVRAWKSSELIKLFAYVSDGTKYRMVIATDWNWYLLEDNDIPDIDVPADFDTELTYSSEEEGKLENGVYYPPYYDNDNNKKDLDARAIISSKTEEDIVAVVVGDTKVELANDESANSLGWHYLDVNNKKVIAKDYPFDTYDNTTYNGEVSETVKLIGSEGGEDTQNPHIKWTFRRKVKDETKNDDGSITVTITYNLPLDKDSIPGDWEPIFDTDGTTIHKIKKTIKKGENYKKDVTVKQNGNDATVTTPVEKIWELPKTGDIWTFASIVGIILVVFGVTRYRKIK